MSSGAARPAWNSGLNAPMTLRVAQAERAAIFGRERFGQEEQHRQRVDRGQRSGGDERRARAERGDQPAERRADDEADAERRAEQPEGRRRASRAA